MMVQTKNSLERNFTDGVYNLARLYPTSSNYSKVEKQYKDKLKKALVQPDDTMNFTAYEGKDTNPKEVIDLSETLPFLPTGE